MSPWVKKDGWLKGYIKPKPPAPIDSDSVKEDSSTPVQYGIIYYPLKCPQCGSKDIKTYSSAPPVRYHKCKKCGYNFRSREAEEGKIPQKVVTTV